MKKPLLLLSAVVLAWQLAGCASSPGTARTTGHTLETTLAPDLPLPFPTDGHEGPLLTNLHFSDPVTELDKRDVLQRFGRPAERLTPDLWIYWRYHAPEGDCDTLVVAFARGRVSTMKLVQGDLLRAHLANAWRPSPEAVAQR